MSDTSSIANARSPIERHFQTIALSLAVPLLCWVAVTLYNTQIELASMSAKLDLATNDRYTASAAGRDLALRDSKITEHERRITRLEAKHDVDD